MAKIMEIVEKETKGKSYHTYKYSFDSIGIPSVLNNLMLFPPFHLVID